MKPPSRARHPHGNERGGAWNTPFRYFGTTDVEQSAQLTYHLTCSLSGGFETESDVAYFVSDSVYISYSGLVTYLIRSEFRACDSSNSFRFRVVTSLKRSRIAARPDTGRYWKKSSKVHGNIRDVGANQVGIRGGSGGCGGSRAAAGAGAEGGVGGRGLRRT